MRNIERFDSIDSFNEYLEYIGIHDMKELGSGSEGACYLLDYENVLKVIDQNGYGVLDYNPDDIIMESDLNLSSFAFPRKLFVVDDCVVGYTARRVKKNQFEIFNMKTNKFNDPGKLNFDNLVEAYKIMEMDVNVLSEHYIDIFDLSHNLLFDGYNLVGIDTLGYRRNPNVSEIDNLASLDCALIQQFGMWTEVLFGENYFDNIHEEDDNMIDSILNIEKTYVPKTINKQKKKKM